MSNGKRAPTKLKKRAVLFCGENHWLPTISAWLKHIYEQLSIVYFEGNFFLQNLTLSQKKKMNKQVAYRRASSYSSSPHHHLYFSISSLLQSWWFTSAPPCNTLLAPILTIKSSQKKMWMMTTKSMPYIRLTSNTTVQTSAVCSYHSSMSMIEKNAKY